MITRNRKLPHSSYYLGAARYGIDALLKQRPMDEGSLFFTVGILASLRAVQHALLNHDSTLSPEHERAIEAWKKSTPFDGPEITFIKNSRDLILKGGAFRPYATYSYSGIGEGENFQMTHDDYETATTWTTNAVALSKTCTRLPIGVRKSCQPLRRRCRKSTCRVTRWKTRLSHRHFD